ncbi:MAG: hypothetical protein NT150_14395 [Bacteroidetes bacterium]|nr:hypothetical protein [Bacteroidota bacterium]
MEIINYKDFTSLRLSDFTSNQENITPIENWEFWEDIWLGESIRFSEWLRLESSPESTQSIAIHFRDFTEEEILRIFNKLKFQFTNNVSLKELEKLFGGSLNKSSFAENRITYKFLVGEKEQYYLSCTFDSEKLTYLVLMNHQNAINSLKESTNKQ